MTTRREFLKRSSALAVLPLIPAMNLEALAAGKVPMDDPAAKALRYVEDATTAKRADKMGVAAADQLCSNCRFYITAKAEGDFAPCLLFQNRLVAGPGWCAGWVPMA
ncbi:MAG: high-potential iron-sulfur protein [Pseudomonadales bacterium]